MLKLMNSAMMPSDGVWTKRTITPNEYKRIFEKERASGFESYVGYPNACKVLFELLGVRIPISRETTDVKLGDVVLVMQLKYRVATDSKATREHGGKLGDYVFSVVQKIADSETQKESCRSIGDIAAVNVADITKESVQEMKNVSGGTSCLSNCTTSCQMYVRVSSCI